MKIIAKKIVEKYATFLYEAENGVVAIEKVSEIQKTVLFYNVKFIKNTP